MRVQETIDELLGVAKLEALPSLMSRRLDVLMDGSFLSALDGRRAGATPDEATRIAELAEVVVTFLEEVTGRLEELEPELNAAEAEADEIAANAAVAVKAARASGAAAGRSSPKRSRAAPSSDGTTMEPVAKAPEAGQIDSERERRAQYRYVLEQLLDAAGAGVDTLDRKIAELRSSLDPGFFAHLQWEVDEQTKAGNRKLLAILETVVQRACVEVEAGQPEVQLLSALLQTQNQMVRREIYERDFKPMSSRFQAGVVQLITETQLELEKKVLRGEQVDGSLLQQLRVLSVELEEYDPPSPG